MEFAEGQKAINGKVESHIVIIEETINRWGAKVEDVSSKVNDALARLGQIENIQL